MCGEGPPLSREENREHPSLLETFAGMIKDPQLPKSIKVAMNRMEATAWQFMGDRLTESEEFVAAVAAQNSAAAEARFLQATNSTLRSTEERLSFLTTITVSKDQIEPAQFQLLRDLNKLCQTIMAVAYPLYPPTEVVPDIDSDFHGPGAPDDKRLPKGKVSQRYHGTLGRSQDRYKQDLLDSSPDTTPMEAAKCASKAAAYPQCMAEH